MAKTSEFIGNAMIQVMREIGPIEKSQRNDQQKYAFRGIDDFYEAFHPILSKHEIFIRPLVQSETREERQTQSGGRLVYTILRVEFQFTHSSGEVMNVITVGEAMDSGDKSANKAMSAALKYALMQTFCVPCDGEEDADQTDHRNLKPKFVPTPKPVAAAAHVTPSQPRPAAVKPVAPVAPAGAAEPRVPAPNPNIPLLFCIDCDAPLKLTSKRDAMFCPRWQEGPNHSYTKLEDIKKHLENYELVRKTFNEKPMDFENAPA